MINILFYGDSNTWGFNPETGCRYPYDVRWTSVAEKALGEGYNCIAAGINGRTTVFDDPWKACRNGKDALDFELQSHKPLDLVVIMLGTNDLKFGDASLSARGIETIMMMVKMANERFITASPVFPNGAKVLLVSPILIGEIDENHFEYDLIPNGHEESMRFASLYKEMADKCGAYFLDAAKFADPSPIDSEHMTPEGHSALGKAIAEKIKEIFE